MNTKKPILFIDRDGTLIEEPADYQVDSLEKLSYCSGVFTNLSKVAMLNKFHIVMVTNQDGLGTEIYPHESFDLVQEKMLKSFTNEGIEFAEIHIDKTFPEEQSMNRKPNIGMLTQYFNNAYDIQNSFVIGDRLTDVELAKNLGCKAILYGENTALGSGETKASSEELETCIALRTKSWVEIADFLIFPKRAVRIERNTAETQIKLELDIDETRFSRINTGIAFLDHMLSQISKHAGISLSVGLKGDLEVDFHHSVEDVALVLGLAFKEALGDKIGIERYGFCLPMDDCLAQVAIDFGGRPYLVWDAEFKRENIGVFPTEMFLHFFKSFTDAAQCNLNIKAEGDNEHHKIEAIFKSFAKAIKMAIKKNKENLQLPSTKGVL